eukprot:TRINITY_DN4525_c2_g1_i6.p4 TRINITY_DN4525_c2_g1~~TRINITY_DN4525_c2_g1_i6.p4  ORF type:complete len:115 (-),score=12.10 TRINITY_DN4525_c2_g1_i6:585-929(-)
MVTTSEEIFVVLTPKNFSFCKTKNIIDTPSEASGEIFMFLAQEYFFRKKNIKLVGFFFFWQDADKYPPTPIIHEIIVFIFLVFINHVLQYLFFWVLVLGVRSQSQSLFLSLNLY